MKFCRQCGFQLNDEDKFCPKCGQVNSDGAMAPNTATPPVNNQMPPQQAPGFMLPDVPPPGLGEAMLVVVCNSVNPSGNATILNGNGQNVIVKNGAKSVMKVAPGNMVIRYRVDRGPGLTLFAARKCDYSKALIFHPGETIIMQVNIGREINNTAFQSSMGYMI